MITDSWGDVINSEENYEAIAAIVNSGGNTVVGWTDERGTHFDTLLVKEGFFIGENIQGGIQQNSLFVGIMRLGTWAFRLGGEYQVHADYVKEKLGCGPGETAEKLAEFINGILKYLNQKA